MALLKTGQFPVNFSGAEARAKLLGVGSRSEPLPGRLIGGGKDGKWANIHSHCHQRCAGVSDRVVLNCLGTSATKPVCCPPRSTGIRKEKVF